MKITVLRLGHRKIRDQRITTHVFLVARAFGCDEGILCGEFDEQVINSIQKVVRDWGGGFRIRYEKNWRQFLHQWEGEIVHLTMYGIPLPNKLEEIRNSKNLLVVVGAEKVPREVYALADWNISITNQPHSEVAALAVFLDRILEGREFSLHFENARYRIVPHERGKKVIKK